MATDSSPPDERATIGIQGKFLREHAPMVFDRCEPVSSEWPIVLSARHPMQLLDGSELRCRG